MPLPPCQVHRMTSAQRVLAAAGARSRLTTKCGHELTIGAPEPLVDVGLRLCRGPTQNTSAVAQSKRQNERAACSVHPARPTHARGSLAGRASCGLLRRCEQAAAGATLRCSLATAWLHSPRYAAARARPARSFRDGVGSVRHGAPQMSHAPVRSTALGSATLGCRSELTERSPRGEFFPSSILQIGC